MQKKLLGICLACCLLAGCTETGTATSSAVESVSIPASSSSIAEPASISESSSSLVESASTPASSSNIAASVPAPQQAVPQSSAPQAAQSEPAQSVEKEYIEGRIPQGYMSPEEGELSSQAWEYWVKLDSVLPASDYAFLGVDEVSGIVGVCTMTPEKVQAVVAEHPNEFIEVRYFPAECTREQLLTEIERIEKEPMIKKYDDEIYQVSSFNQADEYDVIFISCFEEVIPELEDWVKTLHSPFEVRVIVSQKTLPG